MISDGSSSIDECFSTLYDELRRRAYRIKQRDGSVTLNPTALVHEAYLKLANSTEFTGKSPEHIKNTAVQAMRQLLLDAARRRQAAQRGHGTPPVSIDGEDACLEIAGASPQAILDIDLALRKLEQTDPVKARVFEYQFFGGLAQTEIAELLGISEKSVRSLARLAKAWLKLELAGQEDTPKG